MINDLVEGLSWIMVDPGVISRGASSLPECISHSIRFWLDVGATNEIKTIASSPRASPSLPRSESMATYPAVKIYVEKGSNSGRISFANVVKSLFLDLINRG
jgi:hypothetical protein